MGNDVAKRHIPNNTKPFADSSHWFEVERICHHNQRVWNEYTANSELTENNDFLLVLIWLTMGFPNERSAIRNRLAFVLSAKKKPLRYRWKIPIFGCCALDFIYPALDYDSNNSNNTTLFALLAFLYDTMNACHLPRSKRKLLFSSKSVDHHWCNRLSF